METSPTCSKLVSTTLSSVRPETAERLIISWTTSAVLALRAFPSRWSSLSTAARSTAIRAISAATPNSLTIGLDIRPSNWSGHPPRPRSHSALILPWWSPGGVGCPRASRRVPSHHALSPPSDARLCRPWNVLHRGLRRRQLRKPTGIEPALGGTLSPRDLNAEVRRPSPPRPPRRLRGGPPRDALAGGAGLPGTGLRAEQRKRHGERDRSPHLQGDRRIPGRGAAPARHPLLRPQDPLGRQRRRQQPDPDRPGNRQAGQAGPGDGSVQPLLHPRRALRDRRRRAPAAARLPRSADDAHAPLAERPLPGRRPHGLHRRWPLPRRQLRVRRRPDQSRRRSARRWSAACR